MPPSPDSLASELRSAVIANDLEAATRVSAEYTEALRDRWMRLTAEERTVSPLPKQSLELLHWVREMAIMQQALAARHLAMVEKARRYQAARSLYLRSAALGVQG